MAVLSILELGIVQRSDRWDAEYYQPENLAKADCLAESRPVRISSFARITDGIHASPEWAESDGVRYLSAMCVKENFISLEGTGCISKRQDDLNPRTRARVGDVLITTVGTIGNAAVVDESILPANMDRHLGIIRIHNQQKVDPHYLSTFLNSEFGRFQSIRESTGNVQPNLFIKKIENMVVPIEPAFQESAKLTRAACEQAKISRNLYPEAETELLDRLGWEELQLWLRERSFVKNFRELDSDGRIDTEYFEPRYARLREKLLARGGKVVGEVCPFPNRGVQPQYVESGEILVINSKLLGPTYLNVDNAFRTSREFYERDDVKSAHLKPDDVLIYSTGAYIGRTNPYLDDRAAIASNHVTILRPRQALCDPIYLALFLNSPAGLLQSEQFATGSTQRELYPHHIARFLVFLPRNDRGQIDLVWQEELADKVRRAAHAQKEAREKLAQAKKLVEHAILNVADLG